MSVLQLENEFICPSAPFRSKPFWAWNDKLEKTELLRQIRFFEAMGFGGFFMHSRVGLKTAYLSREWFDLVKACVEEARNGGSEAWLYDEDRWPSGAAGGLVTQDPKYRSKLLILTRHALPERFLWPDGDKTFYIYGATFEDDKITWYKKLDQAADVTILPQGAEILEFTLETHFESPWFNNTTYLDTMSREAVEKFIEVTHEAYKREVGEEFSKTIPGIFTDEPNRGPIFRKLWGRRQGIPWTFELPEKFQELFGYDILLHIPEIVYSLTDKPYCQARYHYHCTTTRLFAENYSKQIGEWCEKNNLLFTGHVLEEQPMSNTVSVLGSAMQFYPYMQAPGIDMLTQYRMEYITAKQCVSVAHQTGRKWVLSELYGCTGWETTFETYKHSGDWQAAMGITLRCPHLSMYSMAGEAKRDYPASIDFHSPWWQQYKFVEDYFARLNVLLSEGEPICDLAVIHPVESFYMLFDPDWQINARIKQMNGQYEELVKGLLSRHLDFHFADEHLMVELDGKVGSDETGPYLQIGQMKYRALLVPPLITMRKTTLELLKQFSEAGGKVIFAGETAELVDGVSSDEVKTFAQGKTVAMDYNAISAALNEKIRRISILGEHGTEAGDVLYHFRKIGEDWLLFLANTNRETGFDKLTIKLNLNLPRGGQIQLWDPATGKKFKLSGELTYKSASFDIDLPASGSKVIVIASESKDLPTYSAAQPAGPEIVLEDVGGTFLLDDYNSLVLDRPDAVMTAKGKRKLAKNKMEIIQLDRALREHLDLEPRGGEMTQPWAAKDQPMGPTGELTLTYKFNVKAIPTTPILLGIEQPERWKIQINGRTIQSNMVTGWWVDSAIKTIAIDPTILLKGKNSLTLEGRFDRHADLEIVYLLGQFGVDTDGKNVAIAKLPTKLKLGSWTDQGLPFYAGNIVYRTAVELKTETDKRYLLTFPKFNATAIEITINGGEPIITAWPDYKVDCTDQLVPGKNTIDIKVLGSRRNSFGPLHQTTAKPESVGPYSYIQNPEAPQEWQDEFNLLPYGLHEPPVIIPCKG
jgi:hypothetical protein